MKQKHIYDELLCDSLVMSSDEDQPIVEDLYVGYDLAGNLITAIEHFDYEDKRYDNCVYAEVSRDEAHKLARKLKVPFVKLPAEISMCMEEWSEIINPTLSQVETCFKEIYECLLDEGCRVRIKRNRGIHGYSCC